MADQYENHDPIVPGGGNGGGEGNQNGGRRQRNNEEVPYVAEPERLFHQRQRDAEAARRDAEFQQAVAAAAAALVQREREEQAQAQAGRGAQQVQGPIAYGYQEQRAYRNRFAAHDNPLYLPVDDPPPLQRQPFRQQRRARPTIKEDSVPRLANNSWCIEADDEMQAFELKTNIVHFLPKFAGLPGETATQHLKEYEGVCKSFQPYGMTPDKYKLSMFPFSLTDLAKSWFLSLPSGSIRTWERMQQAFMDKFYPVGKANQIRRELSTIRQGASESLYEYMERFNNLKQEGCNLALTDYQLANYMLDGLKPIERRMLDAAASGSVLNLDPDELWDLVKNTAEGTRYAETLARQENGKVRNVSQVEVSNSQIAEEMKEMREMMRRLVEAQESRAEVNAVGGYQQQNQPYHPPHNRQNYQNQPRNQQNQGGHSNAQQERSLEDAVRHMSGQMQELNATVGTLSKQMEVVNKQVTQLNTDMAEVKAEKGRLPSQTVQNPKCGVNAITTRSEKLLNDQTKDVEKGNSENSMKDHADPPLICTRASEEEHSPRDVRVNGQNPSESYTRTLTRTTSACFEPRESACVVNAELSPDEPSPPLPFPDQLKKPKKSVELDPELLVLFSKVELTIPLIDALKQVPKYAKFIKELCTVRRGVVKAEQKPPKKRSMAATIPREIIPKHKDRGMFIIPCIIGLSCRKLECMLDIGSSINVMPDSIYRTMQVGPLRATDSIVQLANKSCAKPEGIITDVLVRVGELVFLADFFILQDDIKESADDSRIILGRPFMVTARTKTDSWTGEVSMEGNGKKVILNGYHNAHDPPDSAGTLVASVDRKPMLDPDAKGNEKGPPDQGVVAAYEKLEKTTTWEKRYEINFIKVYASTISRPRWLQVPKFEWRPLKEHQDCLVQSEDEELSPFSRKGPDKEGTRTAPTVKT